jgi:predicted polyphosphate/ATP-dependent NAD kinase
MTTDLPRKNWRIGLIVNPVAGMGGAVGLKGTDGVRAARAAALGARPVAAGRALKTLEALGERARRCRFLAAGGGMGGDLLASVGLDAETVYTPGPGSTTAEDTRAAAGMMRRKGADLILFAGGDGTATNILEAIDESLPVLGIPAGVKMHSAVFATSPRSAADVLDAWLARPDPGRMLRQAEVMDRPDVGTEGGSPVLLGYLQVPEAPLLVAGAKAAAATGSIEGACRAALERIDDDRLNLLGPGQTMLRIKEAFGAGSLLGVDAVLRGRMIGSDLAEADIHELVLRHPARIVVGVVGGQGFLFGRGNQQFSPRVIRRVGRRHLLIVCSEEKLAALAHRRLLVDTGDDELDAELSGYLPVLVGNRKTVQMPVGQTYPSVAAIDA